MKTLNSIQLTLLNIDLVSHIAHGGEVNFI